jgi:hypothetical protein
MNINRITENRKNMKKIKIKLPIISIICLIISDLFVQAQTAPVDWQGKISIGGKTTRIYCNINLKETGELYLQADTLQLAGNFTGATGSTIFFPANRDRYGFMHVSGTATGKTELVPGVFDDWDGSPIDLVKSQKELTGTNLFFTGERRADCNGYTAFLGCRNEDRDAVWYLYGTPVLPLIVQLANHTLLVNANSATNGGLRLVHYTWYKNGQLLKEGSHAENGGSYYTGGANLDETAEYTVKVMDDKGKLYFSCPYRYVPRSVPVNVSVYPNPVPRNVKANIRVETNDISLLSDADVEIYDLQGQSAGKMNLGGQTVASLDFPLKSGAYILKFKAKDYVKTLKIMVE